MLTYRQFAQEQISEILIENSRIFIEKHTFENVVCGAAAIMSRPQCTKEASVAFVSLYLQG